jgi:hypothetical protein
MGKLKEKIDVEAWNKSKNANLEKVGDWYMGPVAEWWSKVLGEEVRRGTGDLISNNLRRIVDENDKSREAFEIFHDCSMLLVTGRRWPDHMNVKRQCTTKLGTLYYKIKQRVAKYFKDTSTWKWKRRMQKELTRDPWTRYWAACAHFEKWESVKPRPELRLWRPAFWSLYRALNGKKNNYLFWRKVDEVMHKYFGTKDFVQSLQAACDYAYNKKVGK